MRPKKLLEQLHPLLSKPSFKDDEAELLGVSRRMLNHYVKSGDLLRIGAGIYASASNSLEVDFQICVVDVFRYLSIEIAVKSLKYLAAKNGLNYQKLSEYSKILRVDIAPYVISVST